MTTRELMVGDYITFSDVQNDSYCPKLKVVIIDKEDVYVSIDGDPVVDVLDPKDLAGIPLTPEILEKNGFVSQEYFGECILGDWSILCDTKNVAIIHREHCNMDTPIEYVHELQHALRICRIEKEIEL